MRIYGKRVFGIQLLAILFVGFLGVSEALADDKTAVKKGDKVSLHYTGTLAIPEPLRMEAYSTLRKNAMSL